jgi:hypothetical protein
MQVVNHPRAVSGLVGRCARVYVFHPVLHGIVEQHCDLARRGGHCLCRRRPVRCRFVPRLRQQAAGAPRLGSPNGVCATRALPPEILLLGARQSQEVKCLGLGAQQSSKSPASQMTVRGPQHALQSCSRHINERTPPSEPPDVRPPTSSTAWLRAATRCKGGH